jgi:hypothetical protein
VAGFSTLYVVGGLGGFQGTDGVNPIAFQILVGDANRQWLESHYFDPRIRPLGNISRIVPARPDDPDALLDACIAFYPKFFEACPSLVGIEREIGLIEVLDFNMGDSVPIAWTQLRKEARPLLGKLNIWRADLNPVNISDGRVA